MARIAIVKVRSAHDVEWQLPNWADKALTLAGQGALRERLRATSGQAFMPQLTLPYLAALGHVYNERHGTDHRFELIDDRSERIRLHGYDMVWFTAVTPTAPMVYRLSAKARSEGMLTVIGGIHATTLPEEAAAHCDAVVLGEGESTVPSILADFDRDGRLAKHYRGGRDTRLERLPLPRWQDAKGDYAPWVVPVQTSRGCRNACHFCSTTGFQGAKRRHRPVEEIVDEVRALQAGGVLTPEKVIFFTDNNIVSDSDHRRGIRDTAYAKELFRALAPLGQLWTGQGEIGVADDPELLELMARSGCIQLLVGFESIDSKNLAAVGKYSNNVETYIRQIERLHRYGISLIGCFIFGLDHDTGSTFEKVAPFIEEMIDVPQLSVLTPYPGTVQYRQMIREGRVLHEQWEKYDITHVVFKPRAMSHQELDDRFDSLVARIFSYPNILRRALRHGTRSVAYSHPQMGAKGRFSSVLAPNLVYRALSNLGRGERHKQRPTLWQSLVRRSSPSWAG